MQTREISRGFDHEDKIQHKKLPAYATTIGSWWVLLGYDGSWWVPVGPDGSW